MLIGLNRMASYPGGKAIARLVLEVEMSDYLSVLDPAALARYLAKLKLLGLAKEDDPYAVQ